ncbi:hypothetical protein Tco_1175973 [Tanacetum coccineum]
MSTSNTHQQSLADDGSETRPPMLEREPRMQNEEDLRGDDLKYYEAEIEAMNLILIRRSGVDLLNNLLPTHVITIQTMGLMGGSGVLASPRLHLEDGL